MNSDLIISMIKRLSAWKKVQGVTFRFQKSGHCVGVQFQKPFWYWPNGLCIDAYNKRHLCSQTYQIVVSSGS